MYHILRSESIQSRAINAVGFMYLLFIRNYLQSGCPPSWGILYVLCLFRMQGIYEAKQDNFLPGIYLDTGIDR